MHLLRTILPLSNSLWFEWKTSFPPSLDRERSEASQDGCCAAAAAAATKKLWSVWPFFFLHTIPKWVQFIPLIFLAPPIRAPGENDSKIDHNLLEFYWSSQVLVEELQNGLLVTIAQSFIDDAILTSGWTCWPVSNIYCEWFRMHSFLCLFLL